MPKVLKICPKCKKSPNLVTLAECQLELVTRKGRSEWFKIIQWTQLSVFRHATPLNLPCGFCGRIFKNSPTFEEHIRSKVCIKNLKFAPHWTMIAKTILNLSPKRTFCFVMFPPKVNKQSHRNCYNLNFKFNITIIISCIW